MAMEFRMPRPYVGQVVRFWPLGDVTLHQTEVGMVTKINQRSIDVSVRGTAGYRAVKHVTDPRLSADISQKQFGVWDFTEETMEGWKRDDYVLSQLVDLTDRLEAIEKVANIARPEGKTPQAEANSAKAIEFNELRKTAKDLGATDVHRMNRDELRKFIDSKKPKETADAKPASDSL